MSCRIMVMAISGLPRIQRTERLSTPNFGSQPPWSTSAKSMKPLSPTNRSCTSRTYSASVMGVLANATISCTRPRPSWARSRANTPSKLTEVVTTVRTPLKDLFSVWLVMVLLLRLSDIGGRLAGGCADTVGIFPLVPCGWYRHLCRYLHVNICVRALRGHDAESESHD